MGKGGFNLKIFFLNSVAILINIALTWILVNRVIVINNDKAQLIFLFYYPALVVLNGLIGFGLKVFNVKEKNIFIKIFFVLLGLFIPIYSILIMFF